MTHSRSVALNCSARWIDGRAIFTMVASRTTINCAAAITMSARPRLRGRGAILRSVAEAVEMSMLMHAKPFGKADYSSQDPVLSGDYISGFVLSGQGEALGCLPDRDPHLDPRLGGLEKPPDHGVQFLTLLEDELARPFALLRRQFVGTQELGVAIDDGQWRAQVMTQRSQLDVPGGANRHDFLHCIGLPDPRRLSRGAFRRLWPTLYNLSGGKTDRLIGIGGAVGRDAVHNPGPASTGWRVHGDWLAGRGAGDPVAALAASDSAGRGAGQPDLECPRERLRPDVRVRGRRSEDVAPDRCHLQGGGLRVQDSSGDRGGGICPAGRGHGRRAEDRRGAPGFGHGARRGLANRLLPS